MRGRGEGSVHLDRTRGLWVATIELPSADGKRRRKVIRRKSKTELVKAMREAQHVLRVTGDMPTESQTLTVWLESWLRNHAEKETRPKTLGNYRSLLRSHVIPTIGHVRLSRLTATDIRKVHNAIIAKGRSSTTALTVHRILSSALATAVREGRVHQNVAQLTAAPRRRATSLEVLTLDEVQTLLGTVERRANTPEELGLAYMWATFLLTGARRGEVLGLQWSRITDSIDFAWQLQRHKSDMTPPPDYEYERLYGGLFLTRPKSKAGIRSIPLVDPLASLLERWRQIAPPNKWDLVFATPQGRPIDPDWASHEWPHVLTAAGISKKVRLHDTRHGAVDLLYDAGVPEDVIVAVVGHSMRSMTRAYRSKANLQTMRKALEPYTALLSGDAQIGT